MNTCITNYEIPEGISQYTVYKDGIFQDCSFGERVELTTPLGLLVPQYTTGLRKKTVYAVSFYPDGSLRKISLEAAAEVETSIGTLSAELITFYQSGSIKRIFPLNGQISGYWEEKDEFELARKLPFDLPFGKFEAKVIAISFYEDGKLKDITFWPQERIKVMTPFAAVRVRTGMAMYPNGRLKSIEPAFPIKVPTPIGMLSVYDKNAHGISGDKNSLNFDEDGNISSLITSGSSVTVITDIQKEITYSPRQEVDADGLEVSFWTLPISFHKNIVTFHHKDQYEISSCRFIVNSYQATALSQCENCESCSNPCFVKKGKAVDRNK